MLDAIDLRTVKLDLDRKFSPCMWGRWCDRAAGVLHVIVARPEWVEVRETRKGFHVEIRLAAPLRNALELVLVQALLGSDAMREAFNFNRARGHSLDWNVLFQEKVRVDGDGKRTSNRVKPRMDYAIPLAKKLRARFKTDDIAVNYVRALAEAAPEGH